MNNNYENFRAKVFSAMRGLAKECPEFSDAEMLVAASEVNATLKRSTIHKNIDVEWVDKIEETLPYLDLIVRNPSIMIEDVDEILPVELSRNIAEKTIKHLAQHTNMILTITEKDEVIPQKLLNVYHEETLLTYENKFINTLLARLAVFVDKRYKLLRGGHGIERNYQFRYSTEFDHFSDEHAGRNQAKIKLAIDLTSPVDSGLNDTEAEANERYTVTLARIQRISHALTSYMSSPFVRALGRNYIRPPVIRTNAILKNKNIKVCLNLWEYIESFDKTGFSFVNDEYTEMPSDNYISDLYSSIALQYTDFYNGVAESAEGNRILANRKLSEIQPDFDSNFEVEDMDDYSVYDTEYKKLVPVSRLLNSRKKFSEDERRIRTAIDISLKADEILYAKELEREKEERRLAREKRLAEEEAKRRAEEEAKRLAEEEAKRLAEEEEAKRRAEEEAKRLAEEEAKRQAEEEAKRLAEEEAKRQAEEEAKRQAEEEAKRQAEEEAKRLAEEEAKRQAEEEAKRAAEEEAKRAAEEEAKRQAEEEAKRAAEESLAPIVSEANDEEVSEGDVNIEENEVSETATLPSHNTSNDDKRGIVYADSEDADENSISIPYTRAQYVALPRKIKKKVMMQMKAMTTYYDTRVALEQLKSKNTDNPNTLEKIRVLEEKLANEAKALPKSKLWEECVQRLIK